MTVRVLGGEAAQRLVAELEPQFRRETGTDITGTFGAVGAMRERLIAGEPADLAILTHQQMIELESLGYIRPSSAVDIGTVRIGIAVRAGDRQPPVGTQEQLAAALVAAHGIYFPSPGSGATGAHFARLLDTLAVRDQVQGRLRSYPSGRAAMRAMGEAEGGRLIGCADANEILATPGVRLVAALPSDLDLATVYAAAVTAGSSAPHDARRLAAMLASPSNDALRRSMGFEPA